ncbi:hypothetical protein Nepgr_023428 [Nepenthes gracilis]|uniref:Uncharacterized protein n=1 Tax=Nepenthes gracilis TaxID=150966 RepID=A0AAD3XZE6_NEPGR|nr:hypothetical protein Nepgr_023428 [Nepenthes gracilis]
MITSAPCSTILETEGSDPSIPPHPYPILKSLLTTYLDFPDLMMVHCPGITGVPVHGQPENIYGQIRNIIVYVIPDKSIVLSTTIASSTCKYIRMRLYKQSEALTFEISSVDNTNVIKKGRK